VCKGLSNSGDQRREKAMSRYPCSELFKMRVL
jgi:hypothetical protein